MKKEEKKTAAEIIAQKFIDKLNAGVCPWVKPWELWTSWSRLSGNDYQGVNMLSLSGGEFATFKQIQEDGGKVNKGAKSEQIVHYTEYLRKPKDADELNKFMTEQPSAVVTDPKTGELKIRSRSVKYFNVFNVCDTDLQQKHTGKYKGVAHKWDGHEQADAVIKAFTESHNIVIHSGANQAFEMGGSMVVLPRREQFQTAAEYYSTMFHELTHCTGKELKRNMQAYHKDKKARAREELVAEIGAAYILSFLGIESEFTEANSAAYMASWAQNLKDDASAILYAAPKAIEAASLILKGFENLRTA